MALAGSNTSGERLTMPYFTDDYTLKERLWARPAIEVISLLAGDPEGIERSVIPRKATASLSMRDGPFPGCCRQWELIRSSA